MYPGTLKLFSNLIQQQIHHINFLEMQLHFKTEELSVSFEPLSNEFEELMHPGKLRAKQYINPIEIDEYSYTNETCIFV